MIKQTGTNSQQIIMQTSKFARVLVLRFNEDSKNVDSPPFPYRKDLLFSSVAHGTSQDDLHNLFSQPAVCLCAILKKKS